MDARVEKANLEINQAREQLRRALRAYLHAEPTLRSRVDSVVTHEGVEYTVWGLRSVRGGVKYLLKNGLNNYITVFVSYSGKS